MKLKHLLSEIERGIIVRWTNDPMTDGAWLTLPEQPLRRVKAEEIYYAVAKGYLKRLDDGSYWVTKKGRRRL